MLDADESAGAADARLLDVRSLLSHFAATLVRDPKNGGRRIRETVKSWSGSPAREMSKPRRDLIEASLALADLSAPDLRTLVDRALVHPGRQSNPIEALARSAVVAEALNYLTADVPEKLSPIDRDTLKTLKDRWHRQSFS